MVNNANFYRYTIYNKINHLVFVTSIIINTHVYLDRRGHTLLINLGPFDSKVDMGCRYGSDFCVCVCVVVRKEPNSLNIINVLLKEAN